MMGTRQKVFISTVAVLVLLCAAIFFSVKAPGPANFSDTYHEARQYLFSDRFEDAEESFRRAGNLAENTFQVWQPQFRIATIPYQRGDALESVTQLKKIAAESESPRVTARAIEYLGFMYSGLLEDDLYQKIFSDEPYAGLAVGQDRRTSLKNLYEYAASFYPNSYSLLQVAVWHSENLLVLDKKDTAEADTLIATILKLIEDAEPDFARTYRANPDNGTLEMSLYLKAIALGNIQLSGNTPPQDPEAVFEEAILFDQESSGRKIEGLIKFHYAHFLAAAYGSERADEIRSLLGTIYNEGTNSGKVIALISFYTKHGEAGTADGYYTKHEYDALELLSAYDPVFRSFVEKHSYQQSDSQ